MAGVQEDGGKKLVVLAMQLTERAHDLVLRERVARPMRFLISVARGELVETAGCKRHFSHGDHTAVVAEQGKCL